MQGAIWGAVGGFNSSLAGSAVAKDLASATFKSSFLRDLARGCASGALTQVQRGIWENWHGSITDRAMAAGGGCISTPTSSGFERLVKATTGNATTADFFVGQVLGALFASMYRTNVEYHQATAGLYN